MTGLDKLSARLSYDLQCLGVKTPEPCASTGDISDVVIVGGGQSGLGAAFGLLRERVTNFQIIDENPAGSEGPWVTYARMITLRTPKELTSIDLGVPSLTFRSWWVSQHGEASWESMDKIPRQEWMSYLVWYRDVLNLPVQNNTRLLKIEPVETGLYNLHVDGPSGQRIIKTRKVILATGIQGGGEWHTPAMISESLPRSRYAHTSEAIDYAAFAGKRIGILGAGASAFDNAQHALSLGVSSAEVFVRRKKLPSVNPIRFMEQTGMVPRFSALGDDMKYKIMASFFIRNQPPTNDTFARAAAWDGFKLHMGCPWEKVEDSPNGVKVTTPKGVYEFDLLVLSTGLVTNPSLRPELSDLESQIARWKDIYEAPKGLQNAVLDEHPYLGDSFEYLPKNKEDKGNLYGIFAFNYSALISLGLSASALTGLQYAIPKLANGVANQLFLDKKNEWYDAYESYNEEEFVGEWSPKEKV